jgi:hypothetical protein
MGTAVAEGRADRRFRLQCDDAGEACSLAISGTYDDVVDEGAAHWRRVHGARGEESEVREAVAALMREEEIDWLWPAEMRREGERPLEPRSDWPF